MSPETSAILKVIENYSLCLPDGTPDRRHEAHTKFAPLIQERVDLGFPIFLVIPGFPFKSPDVKAKVLGVLPDMAEEVSLTYLRGMCEKIKNCYKPGVELFIVSDGLVYSDILGIPDSIVWAYGQAVRKIVQDKGFGDMIKFARLHDILDDFFDEEELTESAYLASAARLRKELDAMVPTSGDTEEVVKYLASNEDAKATYNTYINNILSYDLVNVRSIEPNQKEAVANRMILRGKAYAMAIENAFSGFVRLSIHASSGRHKFSISLFPDCSSELTPWHATVGFDLDESVIAGPREFFDANPKYELVERNGIPYYYKEKSNHGT